MNPNNKSIAASINQLMNSDPRRFAQWMNSGACMGTLNQVVQDVIDAQSSPVSPPFANYGACVNLNERLLGEMGREAEPVIYQCRYDRERARQYALQWGSSDAFKDATPGMRIVAEGATDCANFASQVLAAGGFRPTENWYYTRTQTTEQINTKSESWAGVDWLLSWLTGAPRAGISDMRPLATSSDWIDIRVDDPASVVAVAHQAGNLDIGDLIFYYDSDDTPYDHVAIVVGWGSPYSFGTGHIQYAAPGDRVPWIVDHGASDYPGAGRVRPYNYQRPYGGRSGVKVLFAHIPDTFLLHNVQNNGMWDW